MADKTICDDCGCVIVADVHKCIGPPSDKPAQSDAPSAGEFWKTWWPEQIIKRVNYKRESDLSMAFAEAYAALRTAKLREELHNAHVVISECTTDADNRANNAMAKVSQLERERNDFVSFLGILNARGGLGSDVHKRIEAGKGGAE